MQGTVISTSAQPGQDLGVVTIQITQGEGLPAATLTLQVPVTQMGDYLAGSEYDITITPFKAMPAQAAQ